MYLVPFPRYPALNNGVTLKSGLEITQGDWNWYHSKARSSSLLCLRSDGLELATGSGAQQFSNYWNSHGSWVTTFCYTNIAFDDPVRVGGRLPSKYRHLVWYGKLKWRGYPIVKKFPNMLSGFDKIPACDERTDRRTNRRTSFDGIVRAMHSIAR